MPGCPYPKCPRSFDTELGVKVHHEAEHDESIAKEKFICESCGEEDEYYPSAQEGKYCSEKCMGEGRTGNNSPSADPEVAAKISESLTGQKRPDMRGENSPTKRPEVRKKISEAKKGQVPWNKGKKLSEKHIEKLKGPKPHQESENNPNWNGGPPRLVCEWCGGDYDDESYSPDESRFCGDRCKYNWLSESMKGENHHRFNPDKEENYGPTWTDSLREQIRERDDYECQLCRIDQSELDWKLDVHHITPFSEFGVENHEEANQVHNLISLCRYCHGSEEQNPTIPAD